MDNRESCLHFLTWTAFHPTNHTIYNGRSSGFCSAFDEYENKDGVKGGKFKMGFLVSRKIPRMVKFDRRPQLLREAAVR